MVPLSRYGHSIVARFLKAGATGKYLLKPVIKVIPTVLNGISGFVDTSTLASNVRVSALQNGTVIGSTVPNATTGGV